MKRSLLYITPVTPLATGNGLAMRAGMALRGLAEHYSVHLLVVRMYPPLEDVPEEFRRLCREVAVTGLPEFSRLKKWPPWGLPQRYLWQHFETVHVFRMALLPWLQPLPRGRTCHLDMDDLEPETHRRLSDLHRANGDTERAEEETRQAAEWAVLEEQSLKRFDRVYVCSEIDRAKLAQRAVREIRVLPNAVVIPPDSAPSYREKQFRLLFAGTLGYQPNEDAVRYLCREILPELRRQGFDPPVDVVGPGASDSLKQEARAAGVSLAGPVPSLDPWYQRAGAVLSPVRAGGGTRIKILEGFAYGCPVVSTSIGCEGLRVRDGEHLLLRDTASGFAEACRRLADEPGLAEALALNARRLVQEHYSTRAVAAAVAP